jgi:hypothetical protein
MDLSKCCAILSDYESDHDNLSVLSDNDLPPSSDDILSTSSGNRDKGGDSVENEVRNVKLYVWHQQSLMHHIRKYVQGYIRDTSESDQ